MRVGRTWRVAALGGAFALAWVASCHAYSGDEGTAAENDAAVEGALADAGGGTDAGADADATPACIPQPIVVSDAGESSMCNGMLVDLSGNPDHCGFCNHRCADGLCLQGHCAVVEVAANDAGIPDITGADGDVYFSVFSPGIGIIGRYSPASNDATTLGGFDAGGAGVTSASWIKVGGGTAFVIANSIGVVGVPLDGGPSALVANTPNSVSELAIDDGNIYWIDYGDGVHRRPLDADASTQYYVAPFSGSVSELAVDPKVVAFAVHEDASAPDPKTLHIRPVGGQEKVLPALVGVRSIALDEEYIYLGDTSGRVGRVPKSGAGTIVEPVTAIPVSQLVLALAVDDTNVYFVTADNIYSSLSAIWQASKCGGTAHKLVDDNTYVRRLVSDGGYLYWPHSNAIARMSK